jgi:glycosyltransferase involved in cell wall biosynthesis
MKSNSPKQPIQTHSLHILKSEAWGGLEHYSLDLIQHLIHAGLSCSLLCLKNSRVEKEATARNIPLVYKASLIRDNRFTHIHVHQRKDLPLARFFLLGLNKPLLYSLYMSAPPKKDLYHQWIYRRIDGLASSSEWVNKNVKINFPIAEKNIHLIRYGRDKDTQVPSTAEIAVLKTQLQIPNEKLIFGSMCRLDEGKGVLELAKALLHLTTEELSKFELWIIGDRTLKRTLPNGDPEFEEQSQKVYDELNTLTANEKIKNCLRLIPYQKNINLYLKAMDLFVIGSYEETYSLGVIDAMMMGIPLLGTKSGGTIEQIGEQIVPISEQEGNHGFFFKPKDKESTAEAFKFVLQNKDQLQAKGQLAKTWAQKEHHWDRCIKQWLDLYKYNS